MPRRDDFRDLILDRLAGMVGLRARAMFGGHGLYRGRTFFGIIYRDRLYLRTTPATRPRYTAHGMGPFRPGEKQTLWDYYEVPAEVLEGDELLAWAQQAADGVEEGRDR